MARSLTSASALCDSCNSSIKISLISLTPVLCITNRNRKFLTQELKFGHYFSNDYIRTMTVYCTVPVVSYVVIFNYSYSVGQCSFNTVTQDAWCKKHCLWPHHVAYPINRLQSVNFVLSRRRLGTWSSSGLCAPCCLWQARAFPQNNNRELCF